MTHLQFDFEESSEFPCVCQHFNLQQVGQLQRCSSMFSNTIQAKTKTAFPEQKSPTLIHVVIEGAAGVTWVFWPSFPFYSFLYQAISPRFDGVPTRPDGINKVGNEMLVSIQQPIHLPRPLQACTSQSIIICLLVKRFDHVFEMQTSPHKK